MSASMSIFPLPGGEMALPTPPFSPSASVFHHHHHQSCQILNNLIAHYQRERMWVKQTQDVIALARHQHLHGLPETINSGAGNPPLWQRRKSRHSLRLSDLSHTKLSERLLMHNACGTKILDMFATLLDARIESCKRVESLISQRAQRRRSQFTIVQSGTQ